MGKWSERWQQIEPMTLMARQSADLEPDVAHSSARPAFYICDQKG